MPGIPTIEPYAPPRPEDVCENLAPWVADPRRAVLLVHDMQRYFLRPFPAHAEPGRTLLTQAARLRTACAELGIPVAYTAQPGMSSEQRGLLGDFWGPGMRVAPEDREIVEPLAAGRADWMFTKWRYSAFFRTGLLDRMRGRGRDQLIVCGVYAHVGVLMTAVDAFSNDIECFLAADAVADFDAGRHAMALEYAASRCAVVSGTDHLLADLAGAGAARAA